MSQTYENKEDPQLPLAVCQTWREQKPSAKLKESTEYLNCPVVYITNTNIQVPKTYNKAMKRLDPMLKEIEMLKLWNIFEVMPRPSDKNVVGSKWVYAVTWNEKGEIEKRKARTVAKGYT